MVALLLAALGLGLAGLDPAGVLIAVAALAGGARDRAVLGFGLITLLGTALLGTLLSLLAGRQLAGFDWSGLIPAGRLGALIELSLGLALLGWAVLRLRRGEVTAPKPRSRSGAGLLVTGAVFAASAVLDPTFVALVVLAGRGEPWWQVALAHLTWAVVSQVPLTVLLIAVAARVHRPFVIWFERVWARARPVAARVLTGVLVPAGGFLLLDACWFLVSGRFLVPGP